MDIKKTTKLTYEHKDEFGNIVANLSVLLTGDGSTPNIRTDGGTKIVVGYDDYGTPIYPNLDEDVLKSAQKEFMAEAINEQKKLSKENGINPEVVNIIGAEK